MIAVSPILKLLALEQTGRRGSGRRFLRNPMPCADRMINLSDGFDPDGLRAILGRLCERLNPQSAPRIPQALLSEPTR